ncbi:flagellar biosynthetic protein FliR [Thiohalobacter thiocyanaticus]|uniref:flagellar biosynthetic protein FliR n=1 Tax=Thiohalobacter thiocyanaticus TaxID=585455 RepID=UPI001F4E2A3D|nr:flagellar biosynthetic protein FliR [Thiohalobacter thiocyanaticus]
MATPLLFTTSQIAGWIGEFVWPFMRIGAMLMVMPVFGGRLVPARVRVLMAVVLAAVMLPVIPPVPAVDPLSAEAVAIAVQQLLIGLVMGFMLQLVFSALVIGGHAIAMSMGLGFASMVDPQNGVNVPVIGQYYVTLATLLFLALDGHLVLISVLAESFHQLPIAAHGLSRDVFWTLANWGTRMFAGGILIAVPALIALMLTNIAFGVVSRAAPQLNVFGVGFPVTLTFGFVVIYLTLSNLLPQFQTLLTDAFTLLSSLEAG